MLFRGNVDTRLKKITNGEVDATLLAVAGLKRMGLQDKITSTLSADDFLPAPAQGAICVEVRKCNDRIKEMLLPLNDTESETAVATERAFLAGLDGSCRTPIAGLARISDENLTFHGMILTPDGSICHECRIDGQKIDAVNMGPRLFRELVGWLQY